MKIIKLSPAECSPHPLLARMAMEKETIEYLASARESDPKKEARRLKRLEDRTRAREALLVSVKAHGVLDPVRAVKGKDGGWLIADGRHRMEAAEAAGLPLPAVEITEGEAQTTILNNTALRRHISKSYIAWMVFCLNPHLADTQPGYQEQSDVIGFQTRTQAAAAAGISADLLDQAATLWKLTAKIKKKRAEIDAAISAGKSLGGLITGLKSPQTHQEQNPDKTFGGRTPTLDSLRRNMKTLATQLPAVASLSVAHRENAKRIFAKLIRSDVAIAALLSEAAELAADEQDDLSEIKTDVIMKGAQA